LRNRRYFRQLLRNRRYFHQLSINRRYFGAKIFHKTFNIGGRMSSAERKTSERFPRRLLSRQRPHGRPRRRRSRQTRVATGNRGASLLMHTYVGM
jgi:hypothetical protein